MSELAGGVQPASPIATPILNKSSVTKPTAIPHSGHDGPQYDANGDDIDPIGAVGPECNREPHHGIENGKWRPVKQPPLRVGELKRLNDGLCDNRDEGAIHKVEGVNQHEEHKHVVPVGR